MCAERSAAPIRAPASSAPGPAFMHVTEDPDAAWAEIREYADAGAQSCDA